MGKLMQRLVHGMLPSWLTKAKGAGEEGRGKRSGGKVKALPPAREGGSEKATSSTPAEGKKGTEEGRGPADRSTARRNSNSSSSNGSHRAGDDGSVEQLGVAGDRQERRPTAESAATPSAAAAGESKRKRGADGEVPPRWKKRAKVEEGMEIPELEAWAWGWAGEAVVEREEELPAGVREVVGGGSAVVKVCSEPAREFRESMAQMIVGNGLSDLPHHLHFLLLCYLSLNEPHLHRLIRSTFIQVLHHIQTSPPPLSSSSSTMHP